MYYGPVNNNTTTAIDLMVACSRFIRYADIEESPAVWRALAILDEHGQMRVSDFATIDRLSQPSATAMLRRLNEEGLTEVSTDPNDRRVSLASLSAAGRQRLAELRATAGDELEPVMATLDPEQRAELARAVNTLNTLVRAHDPAAAPSRGQKGNR